MFRCLRFTLGIHSQSRIALLCLPRPEYTQRDEQMPRRNSYVANRWTRDTGSLPANTARQHAQKQPRTDRIPSPLPFMTKGPSPGSLPEVPLDPTSFPRALWTIFSGDRTALVCTTLGSYTYASLLKDFIVPRRTLCHTITKHFGSLLL